MKKFKLYCSANRVIVRVDNIKEIQDVLSRSETNMKAYFEAMALKTRLEGLKYIDPYEISISEEEASMIIKTMRKKAVLSMDPQRLSVLRLNIITKNGLEELIRLKVNN